MNTPCPNCREGDKNIGCRQCRETGFVEGAPQFEHDCDACYFLGRYNNHDLYFCPKQVGGPTVIARYGVRGEYCSGMPFAVEGEFGIPELFEAKKRAQAKGLMK